MKKWFMLFALSVSPLLFAQEEGSEPVEVQTQDVAVAVEGCGCGGGETQPVENE